MIPIKGRVPLVRGFKTSDQNKTNTVYVCIRIKHADTVNLFNTKISIAVKAYPDPILGIPETMMNLTDAVYLFSLKPLIL